MYLYKNNTFSFTFHYPRWWKEHCFITHENFIKDAVASIHFNLRYGREYNGKNHTNIFSIIVFKYSKEKWKEKYQDSPFQYLGSWHGRIYAAISPEEPPEEFLKKDKSDYNRKIKEFQMLMRMENIELPRILKSFRFTI